MSGQTCGLAGCSKACARAEHLACGEFHHLLLMAGRYNPNLHQPILDRNAALCAFPSCSKSPWPGHPWCSRTHYLSWLSSFYESLSPLQICKLPGCIRHVYVSDTDHTPPSEFCGWRHCQKFAMLNGLQQQHHYQPPSTQNFNFKASSIHRCQHATSTLREFGHVPSMKSFMHAFKHFALSGETPKGIRVDIEFFTKHPWEVLAEGDSCYLIAQCRRRNKKQRDMVTKDDYHWKQQGPPKEKNGYRRKYFSYRKLEGKKEEAVRYYDQSSYTMKEYVMDDVELYSFVKICKGGKKVFRGGKRRKREDDIGCSQDSATSKRDFSNCQFVESLEELSNSQFVESLEELFGCLEDLPCITDLS